MARNEAKDDMQTDTSRNDDSGAGMRKDQQQPRGSDVGRSDPGRTNQGREGR